jgi:hypothetical protein
MQQQKVPGKIHFYEEEPLRSSPLFSSVLTRFVRTISFGLIKNDTQAGLLIIFILMGAAVAAYYYIQDTKAVEPTTYYELLPQESLGSVQGLPPEPVYE